MTMQLHIELEISEDTIKLMKAWYLPEDRKSISKEDVVGALDEMLNDALETCTDNWNHKGAIPQGRIEVRLI